MRMVNSVRFFTQSTKKPLAPPREPFLRFHVQELSHTYRTVQLSLRQKIRAMLYSEISFIHAHPAPAHVALSTDYFPIFNQFKHYGFLSDDAKDWSFEHSIKSTVGEVNVFHTDHCQHFTKVDCLPLLIDRFSR